MFKIKYTNIYINYYYYYHINYFEILFEKPMTVSLAKWKYQI